MTRADENKVKLELTEAITSWIDETELPGTCDMPYLGYNIAEIMATAALQVLLGVADAQEYLEAEGLLKEDL